MSHGCSFGELSPISFTLGRSRSNCSFTSFSCMYFERSSPWGSLTGGLIFSQHEVQQDVGRILVREPESRLLLAAPPVCRHASGTFALAPAPHRSFSDDAPKDAFPACESTIPFLSLGLCPYLPLVSAPPVHTDISVRSGDDFCSLPPARTGRGCMDGERDLEGRCSGSAGVCGWSCWVVHEGRLDERNDGEVDDPERSPGSTVRVVSNNRRPVADNKCCSSGNGCSGIFEKRPVTFGTDIRYPQLFRFGTTRTTAINICIVHDIGCKPKKADHRSPPFN